MYTNTQYNILQYKYLIKLNKQIKTKKYNTFVYAYIYIYIYISEVALTENLPSLPEFF